MQGKAAQGVTTAFNRLKLVILMSCDVICPFMHSCRCHIIHVTHVLPKDRVLTFDLVRNAADNPQPYSAGMTPVGLITIKLMASPTDILSPFNAAR